MSKESVKIRKICKPEDTIRPEDKTDSKADTTTHKSSHSVNKDVNTFEARVHASNPYFTVRWNSEQTLAKIQGDLLFCQIEGPS